MGSNILGRDGRGAVLNVLPQEGSDLQRGGLAALKVLHQVLEGQARVQNVLDDQHVATTDVDIQVLNDTHDARRLHTVAIARNSHEIDVGRQLDLAHQVAHKDNGAAQDRDQHQILTSVVARNLLAQARNDTFDILLRKQNLLDIRMLRSHDNPFLCLIAHTPPYGRELHILAAHGVYFPARASSALEYRQRRTEKLVRGANPRQPREADRPHASPPCT